MRDGQQTTSHTAVHREGEAHSKPGSRAGPAGAECCSPKVQHPLELSCVDVSRRHPRTCRAAQRLDLCTQCSVPQRTVHSVQSRRIRSSL